MNAALAVVWVVGVVCGTVIVCHILSHINDCVKTYLRLSYGSHASLEEEKKPEVRPAGTLKGRSV